MKNYKIRLFHSYYLFKEVAMDISKNAKAKLLIRIGFILLALLEFLALKTVSITNGLL